MHTCVIKFMKASEKEMWNSVEVHNIYSENGGGCKQNSWNLKNVLKDHLGDSLVVLPSPSAASYLTFRNSCHFRLQNSKDIDDKDIKEFEECIKTETGRSDRILYKIRFDSNTIRERYSEALMKLLRE